MLIAFESKVRDAWMVTGEQQNKRVTVMERFLKRRNPDSELDPGQKMKAPV